MNKEQMNIVIVGHVDHGKSTIIGRLLADTHSLPKGKLEQIKEYCKNNSKPFEYAFLLDALKDEQSQGITIDSARCFFKSKKRDYIIIDAPGHIEFLKNMISGAARAEAALLVIDANEGIQENSKRHGYMLSMLGIKQVAVCVNKMDLVNYDENVFNQIKKEYSKFLKKIKIKPKEFIPVSGMEGDNIADNSENLKWFKGSTILSILDSFEKEKSLNEKPFRMPVQDIYKFTAKGDSRRIIAGRIESGSIKIGDKVVFLPSNKRSTIKTIEEFNTPKKTEISAGNSTGFTLTEQIYVNRREIMCKEGDKLPLVSSEIKANIFWMGKKSMQKNKEYKLKLGTAKIPIKLKEITNVLDASNLSDSEKDFIGRHEVAECILECQNPVAFDLVNEITPTGRFVIVDDYDISGGGIITEFIEDKYSHLRSQIFLREERWYRGMIGFKERVESYGQIPKLLLLSGPKNIDKKSIAKLLEKKLFESGRKVYYLGIGNILRGLDSDIGKEKRKEHIRRLGEVSHILLDAGLITIATASDLTVDELKLLQEIMGRENMFIVGIGRLENGVYNLDLNPEEDINKSAIKIMDLLKFKGVVFSL